MNIYKHAAVSTVISLIMLVYFRKVLMSASCFLSGILIDLDHIFDYYMNSKPSHLAKPSRRSPESCKTDVPSRKVYKPLHGVELLSLVLFLYVFTQSEVVLGIFIGFAAHLLMDFLALGHPVAVSLVFKINQDFPCGVNILRRKLWKLGRDLDRCQRCGRGGEMALHKSGRSYIGPAWGGLSKIEILCSKCRDEVKRHEADGK